MDSIVTLKALRKRAHTLSTIKAALDADVMQFLRNNRGVDYNLVAEAVGSHLSTIYGYAKRAGITLRKANEAAS